MAQMTQPEKVLQAALSLPESDRADIADRLLRSLDAGEHREIDALWAREAETRIDAYERGEIEAIPETVAALKGAIQAVDEGRTRPAKEALEDIRRRHGIPHRARGGCR